MHSFFGTSISLDQFFIGDLVSMESEVGWVIILATLLNSLVGAFLLFIVVERAKKCLDFAFTTHLCHFSLCCLYSGFPSNFEWWSLNIISLIITAVVGEYLCARLELQEIRVSDFLNLKPDRGNGIV